jgi:hypothetical protein
MPSRAAGRIVRGITEHPLTAGRTSAMSIVIALLLAAVLNASTGSDTRPERPSTTRRTVERCEAPLRVGLVPGSLTPVWVIDCSSRYGGDRGAAGQNGVACDESNWRSTRCW